MSTVEHVIDLRPLLKAQPQPPTFYGNVLMREIVFPVKGAVMPGETHHYPHAGIVLRGDIVLYLRPRPDVPPARLELHAGDRYEIPAETYHEMHSLSDVATTCCIFAVRDADGTVAEMVTDWHREHIASYSGRGAPREIQ